MTSRLKEWSRLAGVLLVGVILIAVYKTFDQLPNIFAFVGRMFRILSPFVVGVVLAFLLYRPVCFFERLLGKKLKKRARLLAMVIVYLLLVALLALALTFAIPAIVSGIVEAANLVPGYFAQAERWINNLANQTGWLQNFDMLNELSNIYETHIKPLLTVENLLGYVEGVVSFTSSLVNVLIGFVVSIYLLYDRENLLRTGRRLLGVFLSPRRLDTIGNYARVSCGIFYKYLYGMVCDAFLIFVMASVGFSLIGVPNAILMAGMVGLANMIPYFGAIISGVGVALITLLSGDFMGAVFTGVFILVIQQIDGNFIQPRLYGSLVGVKPLYVILAVTVGGGLFGLWGILLSVPVFAVIQVLVHDLLDHHDRKKAARAVQAGRGSPS